MNFTKRNKKGSALLTTVAMMAILSILIMSILAMTVGGYKLRKETNGRMESFYGADSGLEISERVLINYTEAAVDYSNAQVDKLTGKPTMKEKNEKFKAAFVDFFWKGGESKIQPFYKDSIVVMSNNIYDKTINEIKKQEYYDSLGRNDVEIKTDENSLVLKDKTGNSIAYNGSNGNKTVDYLTLALKSEYIKDDKNREVAVDFDIKVPDYGKQVVKSKGAQASSIFNYIMGIDGDLSFDLGITTQVYGDLWVKGNTVDKNMINSKNKYNGGILIYPSQGINKPEFSLNGGLATGGTLSLKDIYFKVEETSKKDIYANNVKMKNSAKWSNVPNGQNQLYTNKRSLFVYNDLLLEGDSNHILTQNYYGLNDIKNYDEKFGLLEGDRSSSIIINNDDLSKNDTKIDIEKNAYILGTSYIDLEGGVYETGQSNSINKFTKPYTQRISPDGVKGNYIYDYMGNLHLINEFENGNELKIHEKAELVNKYTLSTEELYLCNILKIKGELYNTGAVFATVKNASKIHPPRYFINETSTSYKDEKKTISDLQAEYANEVFNVGAKLPSGTEQITFWNKEYKGGVNDSFKFDDFDKVIEKLPKENENNGKLKVNKKNVANSFCDISTMKTSTEIWNMSKKESPKVMLEAYQPVIAGDLKPQIILNGSDKKLVIEEVSDLKEDGKSIPSKLIDNGTFLTYKINVGAVSQSKVPRLIISKGDVVIKNVTGWNHSMILSAGNGTFTTTGPYSAIIGSYANPSTKIVETIDGKEVVIYEEGQFNYLNELFKYILQDSELMGEIGDEIFAGGTESKEVIESIEVSNIIEKKNWKLVK